MFNIYQQISHSRPLSSSEIEYLETKKEILKENERNKVIKKDFSKISDQEDVIIIKSLISLYSWEDMERIKVVDVTKINDNEPGSIWDKNMGPAIPLEVCDYCKQYDCPGHYGLMQFKTSDKLLKVYNPIYIRQIISVIRCFCKNCSKLLINIDLLKTENLDTSFNKDFFNETEQKEIDLLIKMMEGKKIIDFKYEKILKLLELYSLKIKTCKICQTEQDDYIIKDVDKEGVIKKKTGAKDANNKDHGEEIDIDDIYEILDKISAEDSHLLGFTENNNEIIIRIINDIFNSVINNMKFFTDDFSKMAVKLLDEEIFLSNNVIKKNNSQEIISGWFKLLELIKKSLDKYNLNITEYSEIIRVIITEKTNKYKNKFISRDKISSIINKEIPLLLTEISIVIVNFINIIDEIKEKYFMDIINNNFKVFLKSITNKDDKDRVSINEVYIIDLIYGNFEEEIKNYYIGIEELIINEKNKNISKIDSLTFNSHPRDMIMKGLLIIPRIARPRIFRDGIYTHSSISIFYLRIMKHLELISEIQLEIRTGKQSDRIKKRRTKSKRNRTPKSPEKDMKDSVNKLYQLVKDLIFEKKYDKMFSKKTGTEPLSIYQLIQGKTALIRNSMMGKIVSQCGRTVAGPDPSLKFGQIRLPEIWSSILTKKIKVTRFNIEYLNKLLSNGDLTKRKITNITKRGTNLNKSVKNTKYNLNIGDIVDRWLENGDRVAINRQPTLQKQSMMKYEVVLGKELTIGVHLSYTTPMNADFDGDEINVWNSQNFEVEAEIDIIMDVKNNIMSAAQNKPIMGLVMNSVTSAYLISKSDCILKYETFEELYNILNKNDDLLSLSLRLKNYGVNPFSGNALFSGLLPENFYYNQKGVLIINGILISGNLKKSSTGTSSRSIIQDLHKKYGNIETSNFLTHSSWILNKWITERGFSVGLLDMINLYLDKDGEKEVDKNIEVLNKELAGIYNQLETLSTKLDDPTEEILRQKQIINLSNVTTGIGIKLASDALTPDNSIAVMTEKGAGTKGAVANIGQMMGAVGQQFIYGERMTMSITGGKRSLPTFDENDSNPEAHGFIPTSFFTGLSPESLFFLQAGGRPNLLDTALKTQDTGSLQHKMIKAFENIVIGNDGSIRNSLGYIFSPLYNSGYDASEMVMIDDKIEFSSFVDIKSLVDELNIENGWVPTHVDSYVKINKSKNNKINNDILYSPKTKQKIKIDNIDYESENPNPNKINYFELSRIIGARSKQLENDEIPLINIGDETDFVKIAMMEFTAGKLNIDIIEKYSNGTSKRIEI